MTVQPYQLTMRSGPTPGKIYPLSKSEIYVGRDISNDIAVNDAEISRKHARLTQQEDTFVVEDLGSTNGTFVDAQRLMGPHVLRPGELIMFGENVGMVFEAVAYDPNATVIAAGQVPQPTPAPGGQPAYAAPATPPQYAQQIPASPAEAYARPPKKKGGCFKWVLAGCGCLVVLACLVIVALGIWYAASPTGFEDQVTKVICSSTLKPTTDEILKLFGSYACPVP
jgi:FHA domain